MAAHFQEETGQYLLRIGDTVLLYTKEATGYAFSELSSSRHNCVAVCNVNSVKDPNLPNIHFATYTVVHANKYKAQEKLDNFKKKIKGEPSGEEKQTLQQFQREVELEQKENCLDQERLRGSNIVYGEKVQLQHMLTKKYLTVNTTKISRTENTNLRVELTEENAHGCIFKILPRYKVRSVGDEVRYNDQVKFESIKTEGQFLHCSSKQFGHRLIVLYNCREVNLSATESAFTLIPQYRPLPEHPAKAFRGGQVVRLFHRESECYISAEGSFAEDPPIVENVHFRKRNSDRGHLKPASTSANIFWQFEKESDPRSGEPLSWGERCRIKHLPTRMYLTVSANVDDGYTVSLKQRDPGGHADDLNTMFSMSPVIREEDTILVESYARIKHLQTGTWLHLDKGKPFTRSSFKSDAVGLDGLEWDSAELFTLTATVTMNYDDAFTLEEVSEPLVTKFNYVAGIVPVLKAHIEQFDVPDPPKLTSRTVYLVQSALEDLADYLTTPSDRESKNRQKLLRNLRVLELVIKILGFFDPSARDSDAQQTVCKACYNVLTSYLNGDSRKNENYLARFIGFFKTQVSMGLNAEEVMIEMVEDNSAIVARVAETELAYMIDQLVSVKDPRFMDFLGNLCVCAERPIPSTQRAVMRNLVQNHGKDVFYKLEVGVSDERPDAKPDGIYLQVPGTQEWQDLTEISSCTSGHKSHECRFLESQLNLFARLCKGNNASNIHSLDKDALNWVSFDLILACARHPAVGPCLRSKFVQLMIVMFVDVGNNRNVLENLSLSFVFNNVVEDPYKDTGDADTIALTGEENLNFPKMRDWILEYISKRSKSRVVAEETEANLLLAEVLLALERLVTYGYYDGTEDVEDILKPLCEVLNGLSDIRFRLQTKDMKLSAAKAQEHNWRYEETEENKPIFDIKKRAMAVVDLFLNLRFYIRLQRFIYDFRVLKGEIAGVEPQQRPHQRGGRLVSSQPVLSTAQLASDSCPPSIELQQLLTSNPADILNENNRELVQVARERLKYLFSLTEYYIERKEFKEDNLMTFPQLLLDLANYKDEEIVQDSLHLLNRFFSTEVTLFEKAIQTELLVTYKSKVVFETVRDLMPRLIRNMSIDAGESERGEIIHTLVTFTNLCVLHGDEPHSQNQKILFNYGIMSDVLNYVVRVNKSAATMMNNEANLLALKTHRRTMRGSTATAGADDIPSVFVECFNFLKALARNNPNVQKRLYERMGDLLEINIAVPSIGELLTEVFTGGTEICLKVTEEQVERFFTLIFTCGEGGRAELILTLQAMAKVEKLDLPVKRNQAFIIKFFSKNREKFCDHILGEGEEKVKGRFDLLTDADDSNADLALLLAMTDLLASCAEGENLFIESVCQTVFTVEEILTILNSTFLPPERKRPFSRFLVSVYMNTGGDKQSSGAANLSHSDVMWDYLENVEEMLVNVGLALQAIPASESHLIRHGLSSSSRRYSTGYGKRKRFGPRTQSHSLPFVTGEDGRLLPGILLYITEGVLPLLKAFYTNFYSSGEQRGKDISGKIVSALLQLCEVMTPNLDTDSQVKLYRATVLTMITAGNGDIPLMISLNESIYAKFDMTTKSCRAYETEAMSEYTATYAEEIELKKAFNKFVRNFLVSYQGPNDAREQVEGAKYENEYSEFLDKQNQSKPGDEFLPLGARFQQHVACFISPGGKVSQSVERLLTQLEISFHRVEKLSESERERQDGLDIKCLQIMRAIIHNEVMRIDPSLLEDSPPTFKKKCINRVQPLQNAIENMGNAVARLVPMLAHPNDSIVREVLAFLKAIFFSGNKQVQEGMKYVLDTREERLFTTIQSLLQNSAITFHERRALLTQVDHREVSEEYLRKPISSFLIHSPEQGLPQETVVKETAAVQIQMDDGDYDEDFPQTAVYYPASQQPEESLTASGIQLVSQDYQNDTLTHVVGEIMSSQSPLVSIVSSPVTTPRRRRSTNKHTLDLIELKTLSPNRDGTIRASPNMKIDDEMREQLAFQDTHHVKLALNVIGLMCDGQYRLIQNYLREQKDNIATVNIVGEVALFLQHFYSDIRADTMDLVHLILQTLIEMCVGNYPNQEVIFNRQIIEALNQILSIDIVEKIERKIFTLDDAINLKGSAIELLDGMLEETNKKSKVLAKEIAGGLDIGALHDTLVHFRSLMLSPAVREAQFDDDAEKGMFSTYHILVKLGYQKPEDKSDNELQDVWEHCKSHSRSIEVFYKNMDGDKILTHVSFPFDPNYELREEVIERVKWNINRDSPEDKLRDFLEWMKAIKRDTVHNTRLHQFLPTRYLLRYHEARHQLLNVWSLLMNIFVLMAFGLNAPLPGNEYDLDLDASDSPNNRYTFSNVSGAIKPSILPYLMVNGENVYEILLYLCGSIHLILSIWMVVEYFIINAPSFRLPRIFYKAMSRWRKPPEQMYTDVSVFGLQTVYVLFFLCCSILSLGLWGYFYCFCLLHVIINNDILQRVLRSVTKNGKSLIWVAVLGVIVLFIYAIVSFAFLSEAFLASNNGDGDLFCNTLYECFVSTIRYGLIDNLGLIVPLVPTTFQISALRLLYDISFFIIVTTIGLNIVFGIIVDTFSELRDERFRTEQDKKALCFICGLPSHEFERRADGFDRHVKNDHNMWAYIYYSIYLDKIDVSDHNAIQSFVYEKIRDGQLDFFPLLEALAIEAEEDETSHQLEELKSMVESVLNRFKREDHDKSRKSKLQDQKNWEQQYLRKDDFHSSFDARSSFDHRSSMLASSRRPTVDYQQLSEEQSIGSPESP